MTGQFVTVNKTRDIPVKPNGQKRFRRLSGWELVGLGLSLGDMTEPVDEARVADRAHLLPEEVAAGSEDPEGQAEAILAESDERTSDPEGTQRASSQTPN